MSDDPHLNDPLPQGWSRQFSNSQKKYFYFHKDTKTTQWHFPTAREAKDPKLAQQRAEQAKLREQAGRPAKRPKFNVDNHSDALEDATSVAIIVPFRDLHVEQKRSQHLKQFIPHMIAFLEKAKQQKLVQTFHIYIVEQSNDGRKFNRGKLLNIGFDMARKDHKYDVFIFHDVDLLPSHDLLPWYTKFPARPIHIARVWDRYSGNKKYIGGVVSFSSSDYKRINGFPNNYFGWGGEDDEMQRRLERLGIPFDAPDTGRLTDLEAMDITTKMNFLREHKSWKCMVKWELKDEHERTWKTNGLADLKYSLLERTSLDPQALSSKLTVDIKLNGDHWTNAKAGVDYIEPPQT